MLSDNKGKVIVISAPSGAGKTTLVRHLLEKFDELDFSVSATTRSPRKAEVEGKDYYFLSIEDFRKRIDEGDFLEYEEVYKGLFYGTLKSEIERLWKKGKTVVFDVDVMGAISIKKFFNRSALAVFLKAPSMEELENRLRSRSSESEERIQERISKAQMELTKEKEFDIVLVNDKLAHTFTTAESIVRFVLRS